MKTFKIIKIGLPLLRKKLARVSSQLLGTPAFDTFIQTMVRTMHKESGVGLAANQVGADQHIMVLECRGNKRYPRRPHFPLQAYINLKIVKRSKKIVWDWEGCLSIPGYRGLVPRAHEIWVKATKPDGTRIERRFKGFEARVIQHETDHLNGRFYVDRMPDLKTWFYIGS